MMGSQLQDYEGEVVEENDGNLVHGMGCEVCSKQKMRLWTSEASGLAREYQRWDNCHSPDYASHYR